MCCSGASVSMSAGAVPGFINFTPELLLCFLVHAKFSFAASLLPTSLECKHRRWITVSG